MKKVLFIDRDGTLIVEPPTDYQIDSLEKLEFYPEVFQWLSKIVIELDYILVMVTNQDGLGTDSFPEKDFWLAHNKMMQALKNENIHFHDVIIDRSLPEKNRPTRKPETDLLVKYIHGNYDLKNSFVIGDRWSDVQLAKNLGAKSIFFNKKEDKNADYSTPHWREAYQILKGNQRKAIIHRKTKETDIQISLDLNGKGQCEISTGLSFFDHMLHQIGRHGMFDLSIHVNGDLEIDEHHTIEDVGITLGQAFLEALGSKKGIERYGFFLPMDDSISNVAIDFGGRSWMVWDVSFTREKIGDMPTEMFSHFFKSFSEAVKCNLYIKNEGENEHHKIESIFKAFAKALKMAVRQNEDFQLPTTKGVL